MGLQVTSAEDGAGWLALPRNLVARGLSAVRLVTSDAHSGLTAAIAATCPAPLWQRWRTHYAANLMSVTRRPVGRSRSTLGRSRGGLSSKVYLAADRRCRTLSFVLTFVRTRAVPRVPSPAPTRLRAGACGRARRRTSRLA
jgi:hypothetical protein